MGITNKKPLTIVKGSDYTLTVILLDTETRRPRNLTGFQSVHAFFEKDDETYLDITGSLISAELGKVAFSLSPSDTAGLMADEDADFEVDITISNVLTKVVLEGRIRVIEPLVV